jgi:hypothetical protein
MSSAPFTHGLRPVDEPVGTWSPFGDSLRTSSKNSDSTSSRFSSLISSMASNSSSDPGRADRLSWAVAPRVCRQLRRRIRMGPVANRRWRPGPPGGLRHASPPKHDGHTLEREVEKLIDHARKHSRHRHRDAHDPSRLSPRNASVGGLRPAKASDRVGPGQSAHPQAKNGSPSVHPIRDDGIRVLRKLRRENPAEAYVFVTERGEPIEFYLLVQRLGKAAPRCHSQSIHLGPIFLTLEDKFTSDAITSA